MTNKIFLTDGRSRATLVASKFLSERGYSVHVGEERIFCATYFSRYPSRVFVYPKIENNEVNFIRYLVKLLRSEKYDCIIPVRDQTTKLFSRYKKLLSKYTNLLVPDEKVLDMAKDKGTISIIARTLGIPIPQTYDSHSLVQKEHAVKYPLIARPRLGSGSRGLFLIDNDEAFSVFLKKDLLEEYIVQEYIKHETHDQFVVAALYDNNSVPAANFVLKKLREYPSSGGPMTYAISVKNEKLIEQTNKLLGHINWKGACSCEYILDNTDGEYKLTEINARYFGGLGTSLYAGIDIPDIMCKLATGEKIVYKKSYEYGVKWRWFLAGDLLSALDVRYEKRAAYSDFFELGDCNYAILSVKDIGATLGSILDIMYRLSKRHERRFVLKRGLTNNR